MAAVHTIEWHSPVPLWADDAHREPAARTRPAVLAFDAASFMEDLVALQADATGLRPKLAGTAAPLKLFQAVHGKLYLVAASLVCAVPGLPDHAVNPAYEEKVGFVLRRVQSGSEQAWVKSPRLWQTVEGDAAVVRDGEEILPLGPLHFAVDGRRRRVLIGSIPTASLEISAVPNTPKMDQDGASSYLLRCVFETARCRAVSRVVSDASLSFTVAGFFDIAAPALLQAVRLNSTPRTTIETFAAYGSRLS